MSNKLVFQFSEEVVLSMIVDKIMGDDEFINSIKEKVSTNLVSKIEKSFNDAIDIRMASIVEKVINTDDIVRAIAIKLTGDTSSIMRSSSISNVSSGIRINTFKQEEPKLDLPDLGTGTGTDGFPNCRIVRPAVTNTPIGDQFDKLGISSVNDINKISSEEPISNEEVKEDTNITEVLNTLIQDKDETEESSTEEIQTETPITEDDVFEEALEEYVSKESENDSTDVTEEEITPELNIDTLEEIIYNICVKESGKHYSSFKDFASLIAIRYHDKKTFIFEFMAKEIINNSTSAAVIKILSEADLIYNVRKDGNKKYYNVTSKLIELIKKEQFRPFDESTSEEEQISEVEESKESVQETSEVLNEEVNTTSEDIEDLPDYGEFDHSDYTNVGSVIDEDDDHEPFTIGEEEDKKPMSTRKGMKGYNYIVEILEYDRNGDFQKKFYLKDLYNVKLGKMPTFVSVYSKEAYTFNTIESAVDSLAAFVIGRRSTHPYSELPITTLRKKFAGRVYKVSPGMCHSKSEIAGKDLEKIISDITKEMVLAFPRCKLVDYGDKIFDVVKVRSCYVVLDNGLEVPVWKVKPIF